MTRYAIVDLEATDTSGASNRSKKIIQIGIVIIENWQILDSFSSLVNPHEPLSESIIELTGLSDEALSKAPEIEALIPKILEILKDSVFVAHNVKFDYGLLSQELEMRGFRLLLPRVDTVELSRIFFPCIEKYGLEALSTALDLPNEHQHSALSDAKETSLLLLRIRKVIFQLPQNVIKEIIRHSGILIYETEDFIKDVVKDSAQYNQRRMSDFEILGSLAILPDLFQEHKAERKLEDCFRLNLEKLGLQPRARQEKFAELIEKSAGSSKASFIEGQTGIGKTYAYLLPLLAKNKSLLVSVPTKILQDQVVQEVGQAFEEKFGLTIAKLSAARNYLSILKLQDWLKGTSDGKNTEIFKMRVLVWLTVTKTGELSELSRNVTTEEMFGRIAHDGRSEKRQTESSSDFWTLAQLRAKNADLLIVNHAYLVACLKQDADFIGRRTLIVDEAQRLFTVLENAGQESFELLDVLTMLSFLNSPKKKETLEHLMLSLKTLSKTRIEAIEDAKTLGLASLAKFLSFENKIYWIEENIIKSSEVNFYDFYHLSRKSPKSFFISSNIALKKGTPLLPELLGYEDYEFAVLPAEQAENQILFAVADGPFVNNISTKNYSQYLAECLVKLASLDFPMITLFTSKELMEETASNLEVLREAGITGLSYGIQQTNQHELLKRQFDAGKFQVLLGVGAFWEGVDFEKQEKVILVISRLPFATPEDVLTKKFAGRFENPFYDFNLPMTEMKLRQAFGRVNRKASQKSVVLMLDKRLTGETYAKRLRRHLENTIKLGQLSFEESLKSISDFLK